MSFFDEDDEPTRTRVKPRRAAPPPRAENADASTIRMRQAGLLVGGLVFLLLLVIAFKGCADSRKKNSLKDYNREHTSIVSESDQQVAEPFFDLLGRVGQDSPGDIAANIGSLRVTAEQQLRQAEKLSVPDDMVPAQRALLDTLQFRRDGLDYIQGRVQSALADDEEVAGKAIEEIAGQMQAFLTSDVIHEARTVPFIQNALDDAEIGGQTIQQSRFLKSIAWMDPDFLAQRLGQDAVADRPREGEIRPGTHGNGLIGVSAGDVALEGNPPFRIPSEKGLAFNVKFENQGENDEFDVKVVVRIRPDGGGKTISVNRTVDQIVTGKQAEVPIVIQNPPKAGTAATVEVDVRPVPGEKKTDNNTAEYRVLFT